MNDDKVYVLVAVGETDRNGVLYVSRSYEDAEHFRVSQDWYAPGDIDIIETSWLGAA